MRYCAPKHHLAQIRKFKSYIDLEKKDQGHQNQISSPSCPNVIFLQIWLHSANQFMRYGAHKHFWLKFGSLSPAVTLKIRSRSPKPNQLFIMPQCYSHANKLKIHTTVHEISCKQESVMLMPTPTPTLRPTLTPTPTGSAPNTVVTRPLRWGT